MNDLYGKVLTEVTGKVEDIYIYFQEKLGIQYGDQPIELALAENEATKYLANTITKTLELQKGGD